MWNIYHLLDPNWSHNWKCSKFIEIWHILYFKYASLDLMLIFFIKYLPIARPQKEKCSEFIEIWHIRYFKYGSLDLMLIFFIKYLPIARPQKEKCSEFIEIWPNWYFKYANLDFQCKKYLPPVRPKLVQH